MTVSPYLQLKTRSEAEARQARIERAVRSAVKRLPFNAWSASRGSETALAAIASLARYEWSQQ